jgi:hypothetical protein
MIVGDNTKYRIAMHCEWFLILYKNKWWHRWKCVGHKVSHDAFSVFIPKRFATYRDATDWLEEKRGSNNDG